MIAFRCPEAPVFPVPGRPDSPLRRSRTKNITGFGRCVDGDRNGFTVNDRYPPMRRLRLAYPCPWIVVNGLIAPYQFTGGRVQHTDRAGVAFLLRRTVYRPEISGVGTPIGR